MEATSAVTLTASLLACAAGVDTRLLSVCVWGGGGAHSTLLSISGCEAITAMAMSCSALLSEQQVGRVVAWHAWHVSRSSCSWGWVCNVAYIAPWCGVDRH